MFANETQILQQLTVLVVCHGLATGQIISHYFFVQKPMTWVKGHGFCRSHFVDLAILSTEREYFALINAIPTNKTIFWLGLHRQSSGWKWTNGEELSYTRWYNYNYEGRCGSLEAMLKKNDKLLPRLCDEQHRIVCQGPVTPPSVTVDHVSVDQVNLSWNISAPMQMTSHYYNVTICSLVCETLSYSYTNGSSLMSISISNLTAATEYVIQVSAAVVRLDNVTGRKVILQDHPATLEVKTATSNKIHKILFIDLYLLILVFLVPPFVVIYHKLKKGESTEKVQDRSPAEALAQEMVVELLPERRGLEDQKKVIF
ncbi:uncharacterized protein LOC105928341 [Fundulus heteroclitus]|uniref:uncharacterized protein LOC105928341 n=1 Tax=Fundulus heteroclitus TaxID=8078 RepID=UPI00165C4C5E|nr:uncharacterized protein LOC105928341 [Fundulus heteroclitus]